MDPKFGDAIYALEMGRGAWLTQPFYHVILPSLFVLARCLHFNGHFPCGPGLADTRSTFWILLQSRMTEVVVTTGAISCAKLQSNHRQQQTQHPAFYRPDDLPVAQTTVSEH